MMARSLPAPINGVDLLMLDLDGVIYRGAEAIPHAVESARRAARLARVTFVTNNASRTDGSIADHLTGLGLDVQAHDVVTSPHAAVRLLADHVPHGSLVLVVGGAGLTFELERAGYSVTRDSSNNPTAVVQGFAREVGWVDLAEASIALHRGIPWIATNLDWTLPVPGGLAPGNGTLVAAVHTAVGRLPMIAGKPQTAIFEEAVSRFSALSPLFIGDRLDTDIVGANRAGIRSGFVLTGVDQAKHLLAADAASRPQYIFNDLRELFEPYPSTTLSAAGRVASVGDARVRLDDNAVTILKRGSSSVDLVRAACSLVWKSGRPIYSLDIPLELSGKA